MGKIKCLKLECPICHNVGLAQIFLRKESTIRYCRVRHYLKLDSVTRKPLFEYHKVEDLHALETLLPQQGISLSESGQTTQGQIKIIHGPNLNNSSLNQELEPRAGFGPATITLPR